MLVMYIFYILFSLIFGDYISCTHISGGPFPDGHIKRRKRKKSDSKVSASDLPLRSLLRSLLRSPGSYNGMNPFSSAIFCPSEPSTKSMNFWALAVGCPKV